MVFHTITLGIFTIVLMIPIFIKFIVFFRILKFLLINELLICVLSFYEINLQIEISTLY